MFVETLKYIDASTYKEIFFFTGKFVIPRVGEKVYSYYDRYVVEAVTYYNENGLVVVTLRSE
jgi:hypothetical protein